MLKGFGISDYFYIVEKTLKEAISYCQGENNHENFYALERKCIGNCGSLRASIGVEGNKFIFSFLYERIEKKIAGYENLAQMIDGSEVSIPMIFFSCLKEDERSNNEWELTSSLFNLLYEVYDEYVSIELGDRKRSLKNLYLSIRENGVCFKPEKFKKQQWRLKLFMLLFEKDFKGTKQYETISSLEQKKNYQLTAGDIEELDRAIVKALGIVDV